jgi:hypothetical protein
MRVAARSAQNGPLIADGYIDCIYEVNILLLARIISTPVNVQAQHVRDRDAQPGRHSLRQCLAGVIQRQFDFLNP